MQNRINGRQLVDMDKVWLQRAADLCAGFDTVDADLLQWSMQMARDAEAFGNRQRG